MDIRDPKIAGGSHPMHNKEEEYQAVILVMNINVL